MDLVQLTAREAVGLLRTREISPSELVAAALSRIEATDKALNALPTLCGERALERARAIERSGRQARDERGWLAGLPIAVKDMTDVAGVRSTYGSTIFAERVPARSDIAVETLEARGAIVIAKSNTPAFASSGGLRTTNRLFGATKNPWHTAYSTGGSSGGSAAALAAGEVWLATGTDLGGSLRQPASFCGVVGLRPTPGRVARGPASLPFDTLCVAGPMARTAGDVALMLDAMAGEDARDPISLPAPAVPFVEQMAEPRLRRVAYHPTLGLCPVSAEVARLCESAVTKLRAAGVEVAVDSPDLTPARDVIAVLRPAWLAAHWGSLLDGERDRLEPDFAARLEAGRRLTAPQLRQAEATRAGLCATMARFFERHDLLACPTAPIAPPALDVERITEIDGVGLSGESDWMLLTYAVSLTGSPAISVPCGSTRDGLPVGVQLIGRPRAEGALLAAAALLEKLAPLARTTPVEPRRAH